MKVTCLLHREGGTKVELGNAEYHFKPQPDGKHVAEVSNEEHLAILLAIPEAYRLDLGSTKNPLFNNKDFGVISIDTKAPAAPEQALHGSSVHPANFEIHGVTYLLGDIVAKAYATSKLSVAAWNELPDEERHALLDAELDALDAAGPLKADTDVLTPEQEAAELEALRAQFVVKFGKKPHPQAKAASIRAKLAE